MNINVAQECPQCGGATTLTESDRLLICSFCGVKNFLQPAGIFRYLLPPTIEEEDTSYLLIPYIRFKGTVFLVTDKGLSHKIQAHVLKTKLSSQPAFIHSGSPDFWLPCVLIAAQGWKAHPIPW